jgi:hypothetical protein
MKKRQIFLFSVTPGRALGPTETPTEWAPGAHSPGVRRPEREANHLPHLLPKLGMMQLYRHSPYTSWCGALLIIPSDNCVLTFTHEGNQRNTHASCLPRNVMETDLWGGVKG